MARGPQAYLDGMFPLGFQAEGLIESSHFVNAGQGDIEAFGDLKEGRSGKIVHPTLNILQDADERRPLITMAFNDFAYDAQIYLHLISLNRPYCLH
jgi:hypothetical protein